MSVGLFAQMTDDQIIDYVKSGVGSGKDEQQIAKELLARGVSPAQVERLKIRYNSETHGTGSIGAVNAERVDDRTRSDAGNSEDYMFQNVDASMEAPAEGTGVKVYGHNIFSNRNLTFEPNENMATPENYKLGPGDEIIIDIWGVNEDNLRQKISPEGNIMVSQIGPIFLNGLTIREAENKVKNLFARKYSSVSGENPGSEVSVTLGQIRSIIVNVMGEVNVPGTYRLSSFSSVFHALYCAGGVTGIGSLRNIDVVRKGRRIAGLDVYEYLFGGKDSQQIRLEEGDVIIVPTYDRLVRIDGNIKRPMYYEMKDGETLEQLVEYAGGFSGNAYSDEVRLVRKSGREFEIFNVVKSAFGLCRLDDGDVVSVDSTLDRFANRVEVRGSVFRPGTYAIGTDMMTVKELVDRAEGLTEDAFTARALLFREKDDLSLEMVAVNIGGIMDGSVADIVLRRNDVLTISSRHELDDRGDINIYGEVSHPGTYAYAENTTVEDLIMQAGGLLESASTVKIDVSRRVKDPKATSETQQMGIVHTFSFKDGFVIDGEDNFYLEPYDVVMVRKSPSYHPQRVISLEGEITFPGTYTLIRKNERLSDLVRRAGGATSDSYLRGARLVRKMTDDEMAMRNETIRMASRNNGADSLSVTMLQSGSTYTVGIELDKAIANPGSNYDMVLREGDRLIIPEFVSTVTVSGNVLRSNTVLYQDGKSYRHYIAQAGGFGNRAKKSKVYVVYMNGIIARAGGRKARIEPGCEIIVPSKKEGNNAILSEILGVATTAASLGTMAASITNLVKVK